MDRKNKILFLIAVILFALRIFAGRLTGIVFIPHYDADDALMVRCADLYDHFIAQTTPYPDSMALVKDMGFPIFLSLLKATGISYPDAISLMWLISAVIFVALFVVLTKVDRKEIWLLIYAFVLFMPVTFSHIAIRLYRNSALAPFYFATISMAVLIFSLYWQEVKISFRKLLAVNIFFGIIFTWTFYMKEDGIWLLMSWASVAVLCLVKIIFLTSQSIREKIFHVVSIALPLVIFFVTTLFYLHINEKYFGVRLINNRVEGELGEFVKNIYKIKSDTRTGKVWATTDVILAAFDASETLKANIALKDRVLHTRWFNGNIFDNPIRGDFLGWVMPTALSESQTCASFYEQEKYLAKVNSELKAAFDDGTLAKDDKFRLTASMGGLSLSEIFALRDDIITIYLSHIVMSNYDLWTITRERLFLMNAPKSVTEYSEIILKASEFTNVDLFINNTRADFANTFSRIIFKVYGTMNFIMFITAFLGVIITAIKKRSYTRILTLIFSVGSLILSLVYSIALAWFCQFMDDGSRQYSLTIYSVGIIPLLTIFEIFGTYLFISAFKSNRKEVLR